jgi:hypothetical protein
MNITAQEVKSGGPAEKKSGKLLVKCDADKVYLWGKAMLLAGV